MKKSILILCAIILLNCNYLSAFELPEVIKSQLEEYAGNKVRPMIIKDSKGVLHLMYLATLLPESYDLQVRYCKYSENGISCCSQDHKKSTIDSDVQMLISPDGYVYIIYGHDSYYLLTISNNAQILSKNSLPIWSKKERASATVLPSDELLLIEGTNMAYYLVDTLGTVKEFKRTEQDLNWERQPPYILGTVIGTHSYDGQTVYYIGYNGGSKIGAYIYDYQNYKILKYNEYDLATDADITRTEATFEKAQIDFCDDGTIQVFAPIYDKESRNLCYFSLDAALNLLPRKALDIVEVESFDGVDKKNIVYDFYIFETAETREMLGKFKRYVITNTSIFVSETPEMHNRQFEYMQEDIRKRNGVLYK